MVSIVDRCIDAAQGDPWLALTYAARVTRWRLIIAGRLPVHPAEAFPLEVRRILGGAR
jgi:hypothetical protein